MNPIILYQRRTKSVLFREALYFMIFFSISNSGMACWLLGALKGSSIIPSKLRFHSETVNKRDFCKIVDSFFDAIVEIMKNDDVWYNLRKQTILN
jgi:hypothetical protein